MPADHFHVAAVSRIGNTERPALAPQLFLPSRVAFPIRAGVMADSPVLSLFDFSVRLRDQGVWSLRGRVRVRAWARDLGAEACAPLPSLSLGVFFLSVAWVRGDGGRFQGFGRLQQQKFGQVFKSLQTLQPQVPYTSAARSTWKEDCLTFTMPLLEDKEACGGGRRRPAESDVRER